jgi:hypothetical protein
MVHDVIAPFKQSENLNNYGENRAKNKNDCRVSANRFRHGVGSVFVLNPLRRAGNISGRNSHRKSEFDAGAGIDKGSTWAPAHNQYLHGNAKGFC